jgi:hypothetical protein
MDTCVLGKKYRSEIHQHRGRSLRYVSIRPMIPARNPKGRESGTHSEDLNFKKVAGEPNRFENVFIFRKFRDVNEPDAACSRKR